MLLAKMTVGLKSGGDLFTRVTQRVAAIPRCTQRRLRRKHSVHAPKYVTHALPSNRPGQPLKALQLEAPPAPPASIEVDTGDRSHTVDYVIIGSGIGGDFQSQGSRHAQRMLRHASNHGYLKAWSFMC